MEELKLLQGAVEADPKGVQQSLQLNGVERAYSTPELVGMVQELMGKVLPGLLEDLEELLESVALRYGTSKVPVTRPPKVELMLAQSTHTPTNCDVPPCFELSRENMVNLYGTRTSPGSLARSLARSLTRSLTRSVARSHASAMDVVEKRMSNREYMSRFRLNTKFASALLPSYDHTTATPTIYGALERLLLADITVCTVDGRAFPVVYELARTIKNDWLHHRFTAGWAEVVRQLGIEIGDMLVFERWTEDRTILTMTILKQHSVDQENPDPTWKPMTSAEKKGQF